MNQVLDYSAGFPGAAAIDKAGYAGAVRYTGYPNRRKCTTRGELQDFTAHQLGMALVFENNTTDWRGGYFQGQASAATARAHATSIGFPTDRPIYMAVDQDVATEADFKLMLDYLRGASNPLGGPGLTGMYGEADAIDRARNAGVATWFWQTAAWSRGRHTAAHLYQRIGAVTVSGISCDVNDILQPDWGQHNAGDDMPLSGEGDKAFIVDAVLTALRSSVAYERNLEDAIHEGSHRAIATDDRTRTMASDLVALAAKTPGGPLTDGQVADLALQLANGPFLRDLPKDTAAEVLRLAAQRFADPQ